MSVHPTARSPYKSNPENAHLEVRDLPSPTWLLGPSWEHVPWRLGANSLFTEEAVLLKLAASLRSGDTLYPRDLARVLAWEEWLDRAQLVLDHDAETGLHYVERAPGDTWVVRRPRAAGPCQRIFDTGTGSTSCSVHRVIETQSSAEPEGCTLIRGTACRLCWRVVHFQVFPKPSLGLVPRSPYCARCSAALTVARVGEAVGVPLSREPRTPNGTFTERVRTEHAPVTLAAMTREAVVIDLPLVEHTIAWTRWSEHFVPSAEASARAVIDAVARLDGGRAQESPILGDLATLTARVAAAVA